MNLNKHLNFFNPLDIKEEVHVIGCGALGSYTAQQLVKLGLENIHLWDFDIVEPHNLTNQLFTTKDLNTPKLEAVTRHLKEINELVKITHMGKYEGQTISGIVFLCVDSIEVRHLFYEMNEYNTNVKYVFDERIALTSGQVYSYDWANKEHRQHALVNSDFKDSEVTVETSACGTTLSVSPSVLQTVLTGIASMINTLNGKTIQKFITFDAFDFKVKAYE